MHVSVQCSSARGAHTRHLQNQHATYSMHGSGSLNELASSRVSMPLITSTQWPTACQRVDLQTPAIRATGTCCCRNCKVTCVGAVCVSAQSVAGRSKFRASTEINAGQAQHHEVRRKSGYRRTTHSVRLSPSANDETHSAAQRSVRYRTTGKYSNPASFHKMFVWI
jgi:hypothetical protein